MEISRIVIQNLKAVERIELSRVRPINVLIGRNNSGKSSVLAGLRLLTEYYSTLNDRTQVIPPAFKVPRQYFRSMGGNRSPIRIEVTVAQSYNERREQFQVAVEKWNKQFDRPKMDPHRVDLQLENDLFGELTFIWCAESEASVLGLTSIETPSAHAPTGKAVAVASAPHPGQKLRSLFFPSLFAREGNKQSDSVFELAESQKFNKELDISATTTGLDCQQPIFVHHLLQPAWDFSRQKFSSAYLLNPYRHGREKVPAQRCDRLAENGTNLVEFILNLNLNNYCVFQEVSEFVKRIAPEVGRLHPQFSDAQTHDLELAYDWADGRTVNLSNMGGGSEQLIVLGCLLIAQRTSCILWEEPESHLHPGAQDALLTQLEKLVGDSLIFLTTHSPVFVRPSNEIAVHAIINKDGKSATGRTLLKDELQGASVILGSRPGHLAQADIVVYVEGKSGAAVLDEWLKKWPDRDSILGHLSLVTQPCNPDEIGTEDFDLRTLQRLTPNMIVFVDRDNDPGSRDPKKSRQTLASMCERLGIPCIITKQRQIEDYFTESAVKDGLPGNLLKMWTYDPSRPMSEQLGGGWKRHNRAIAEAMVWEDISQHADLKPIFDEIERYAAALKP